VATPALLPNLAEARSFALREVYPALHQAAVVRGRNSNRCSAKQNAQEDLSSGRHLERRTKAKWVDKAVEHDEMKPSGAGLNLTRSVGLDVSV
jgi:hypothetical protein